MSPAIRLLFPLILTGGTAAAADPFSLHPDNPHYFQFRGKPTVLITSGEHYGAVLNKAFDYRRYLDTLAADKLNLTRTFTGLYREVPGESFAIAKNTLAPEEADFVQPFRRVGPQKYDLTQWNDEYFRRWKDFLTYAGQRGIVVEVTLFTTYYNEKHWALSPLNASNNLQGIGKVKSTEVLTLKEAELVAVEERFVRKLVAELNGFDNLYYEICNEPYFHGVTEEWQRLITRAIKEAESKLPVQHLISRNIANHFAEVKDHDPDVSILNFHYARPPQTVAMNYALKRPIGMNETGFDGTSDSHYRIQGWDFLLAGGALYNNLDYSFTVQHEDGTFAYPGTQPGGGTAKLRSQLQFLTQFMETLPFAEMSPDQRLLKSVSPDQISGRALSNGKTVWAIYLHGGKVLTDYKPSYVIYSRKGRATMQIDLPEGSYVVEWWQPGERTVTKAELLRHAGGAATLQTPSFSEDMAAIIRRK